MVSNLNSKSLMADFSQYPVWDRQTLGRIVGNDELAIKMFTFKFLEKIKKQTQLLIESVHPMNSEIVHKLAHSLKSSARTIGGMRMGEVCNAIENVDQKYDYAQIIDLIQSLQKHLSELEYEIRQAQQRS